MNTIIILALLFLALALASFFSKRRFGNLGLALAAGSLLSVAWAQDASYIVSSLGLVPVGPMTVAVSNIAVLLLPSVILLFKGKKYGNIVSRIIGSIAYGLLGVTLALPYVQMLSTAVGSQEVVQLLTANKNIIIGACLSYAVVDLLLVKPAAKTGKKSKH